MDNAVLFFELKYHDAREVFSMINKDFLESLYPVEIQMVHQYNGVLFKDRIKDDTSNFDNLKAGKCPYCGSKHSVKNGHDPKSGRQGYVCRGCHSSFRDSTIPSFPIPESAAAPG